jgi:hypothetical protein
MSFAVSEMDRCALLQKVPKDIDIGARGCEMLFRVSIF